MKAVEYEPWKRSAIFAVDGIPVVEELKRRWRDIRDEHYLMRASGKGDSTLYPVDIFTGCWLVTCLRGNEVEESYIPAEAKAQMVRTVLGEAALERLSPREVEDAYRRICRESEAENRAEHPTLAGILDPLYPHACVMYNYSSMSPGVNLRPHSGRDDGNVRVHLCVREARGCYLNVMGEQRTWRDGEVFAFDDASTHSAWHHGRRERVVVIADFTKDFIRGELRALRRGAAYRPRTPLGGGRR